MAHLYSTRLYLFVLADDLTGAVDSASYFHRGNYQVVIDFQRQLKPSIELISNVIQILDTETREGSEEDAYERVLNAAFALAFAESSIGINGKNLIRVYKKVDSTLRGHIGVEIAAAMRGLSRSLAILAPAFPQNGRVVRGGRLYVNGLPVDQTDFANDPNNPIHFSRVSELMSCSGELSAYEIPLSTLRRGAEIILRVILEFEYDAQIRGKRAVIIPDVETDEDLVTLAQVVAKSPEILPIGSPGFAKALADVWLPIGTPTTVLPGNIKQVLLLLGSANPVSHRQFERLTQEMPTLAFTLPAEKFSDQQTSSAVIEPVFRDMQASMHSVLALRIGQTRVGPETSQRALRGLVELAASWVRQSMRLSSRTSSVSSSLAVIVSGGETAIALCRSLDVTGLRPQGELASGVPWSFAYNSLGRFLLVTKAGGFGDDSTFVVSAKRLLGIEIL